MSGKRIRIDACIAVSAAFAAAALAGCRSAGSSHSEQAVIHRPATVQRDLSRHRRDPARKARAPRVAATPARGATTNRSRVHAVNQRVHTGLPASVQRGARSAVETLLGYIRLVDRRDPTVCTTYLDANLVHKLTGKGGHAGVAACQATIAHTPVPPSLVRVQAVRLTSNVAYVLALMAVRKAKMALLFRMVGQSDGYVIDSASALLPKRKR